MGQNTFRIVIVEDHITFAEKLKMLLSTVPGVEIIGQAGDASSGIAYIHDLHPDAAIIDVRLRDKTGFDILTEVKRKTPSIAVLIMTGYDEWEYVMRSQELGADYFFQKSNGLQDMLGVVTHLRDQKIQTQGG